MLSACCFYIFQIEPNKIARMSEYGFSGVATKVASVKEKLWTKLHLNWIFRNEPNFNAHHKVSEHLKFTFLDKMKLKSTSFPHHSIFLDVIDIVYEENCVVMAHVICTLMLRFRLIIQFFPEADHILTGDELHFCCCWKKGQTCNLRFEIKKDENWSHLAMLKIELMIFNGMDDGFWDLILFFLSIYQQFRLIFFCWIKWPSIYE